MVPAPHSRRRLPLMARYCLSVPCMVARLVAADGMVLGFGAAFLLPLVTGALSQLLPVWRFPAPTLRHGRRCAANWYASGRLRACLFLAGAACIAELVPVALCLAASGLLLFAADLVSSLAIALQATRRRRGKIAPFLLTGTVVPVTAMRYLSTRGNSPTNPSATSCSAAWRRMAASTCLNRIRR